MARRVMASHGRQHNGGSMVVPVLICFGLIAVLLIADFGTQRDTPDVVVWLIILLAIGLVMWGLIAPAIGFKQDIYQ